VISETKRIAYIDALRGLAVLGVLLAHTPFPGKFGNICSFLGAKGVQLFYVVSAFTLCVSLATRFVQEASPLRNFFIRRFFRIAPMFYVAVCFFLFWNGLGPNYWAPQGIGFWHIVSTIFFFNGWHPETINTIVPGGWSVAIETNFYALLPLFFAWARTFKRAFIATIFLSVGGAILSSAAEKYFLGLYPDSYAGALHWFSELWFPSQAAVFACGVCLFHLSRSEFQGKKYLTDPRSAKKVLAALFTVFLGLFFVRRISYFPPHVIFAGFFVIFALLLSFHPYAFLVNRFSVHVGKVSYSIYLLHFIFITFGKKIVALAGMPEESYPGGLFIYFFACASTILLATLTYKFIEVPGMNFGKRLIKTLEAKAV
jgi:peptidoglycan/LPS O-acetylase OafA/YrhL